MAVVVAGGGARGAYEAGALSVLLPALEADGSRPQLCVGTSAGAVNAVLLAATAHLPAQQSAAALLEVWRGIGVPDVFRPLLRTGPVSLGRWAGQLLGVPGVRLHGLVDTAPLAATAQRVVDWPQLRRNLDGGAVALAVVATSGATGRTTVFVDRRGPDPLPPPDDARPIDYVAARVEAQHVLASAAIPVLFPPVGVVGADHRRRWYVDGGVRLNTPLKPALALGADAVVVVATHPATCPSDPAPPPETGPPDRTSSLTVASRPTSSTIRSTRAASMSWTMVSSMSGRPVAAADGSSSTGCTAGCVPTTTTASAPSARAGLSGALSRTPPSRCHPRAPAGCSSHTAGKRTGIAAEASTCAAPTSAAR